MRNIFIYLPLFVRTRADDSTLALAELSTGRLPRARNCQGRGQREVGGWQKSENTSSLAFHQSKLAERHPGFSCMRYKCGACDTVSVLLAIQ